jgi:hypothetical protein
LIGAGIPEYEAKRYEGRIRSGGILLSVHCEDDLMVSRAKQMLRHTGAEDIASAEEARVPGGARRDVHPDHVHTVPVEPTSVRTAPVETVNTVHRETVVTPQDEVYERRVVDTAVPVDHTRMPDHPLRDTALVEDAETVDTRRVRRDPDSRVLPDEDRRRQVDPPPPTELL